MMALGESQDLPVNIFCLKFINGGVYLQVTAFWTTFYLYSIGISEHTSQLERSGGFWFGARCGEWETIFLEILSFPIWFPHPRWQHHPM
jgi:hypothetical protein